MQEFSFEKIPTYIQEAMQTLEQGGFEAYLVGGCVRDVYLYRTPKDWDITTNAKPEDIQKLFEHTVYENDFGTVGVVFKGEKGNNVIEITPYRTEGKYTDKRHPDSVSFTDNVLYDLKRRDFTINDIAISSIGHVLDPENGRVDIERKIVKTVGNPDERFQEDALRMMRAIRFSTELGFAIEQETAQAILRNRSLIANLSHERIRDEFVKIIMSSDPMLGIALMKQYDILHHVIPELEEGIGCIQGGAHIYDVFEHCVHALGHAAEKGWPLEIRLAALFHDIGKPKSRRPGIKKEYTFYGHEVIGARMAKKILERLHFSNDIIDLVVKLVRYHMFFSDTKAITLSAVRRTIVNIGREHIWELMQIRECDRVGMKKAEAPYRLRKYHAMIEEALRAPTSVSMLKINGAVLINDLGFKPSPRMGWILHALLEECLEDDSKNNLEYLKQRALILNNLTDNDLKALGQKGKEKKEEIEEQEIEKLHEKHGVKK